MSLTVAQIGKPNDPKALEPGLYLVPTPIGNLEDITLRALRVLAACDMVAADPVQALEVGIKAQKQAVEYYAFLRDATRDDKGQDVFDRLRKEAGKQLDKLEEMKEKL